MLFFSKFVGYGSFPRRFKLIGWASKVEIDYKNSFKQMILLISLFGKISLTEQKTEAKEKMLEM